MKPTIILQKYNILPKKGLGQNFLVNEDILDKIADYLEIKNKNIIEVGPGYGALTEKILDKNPASIELVELDKKMVEVLNLRIKNGELSVNMSSGIKQSTTNHLLSSCAEGVEGSGANEVEGSIENKISTYVIPAEAGIYKNKKTSFEEKEDLVGLDLPTGRQVAVTSSKGQEGDLKLQKDINFKIHNIDVLKFEPENKDYIVVANIPYYITSPILNHFLYKLSNKPKEMLILMQKDVGDKILKKNGNKTSVLSLMVDFMCSEVKEIIRVAGVNFIPAPKVESSVLYFKIREDYNQDLVIDFLNIIKLGFSEKRKKLISNLSKKYDKSKLSEIFAKFSYNENIRAEELSLEDWIGLTKEIIDI